MIEINIGGEGNQVWCFLPKACGPLLDMAAAHRPHIRLRGLMCIPPAAAPDGTRAFFAQMRELLAKAADRHYENAKMDILSMGMSGDYPDAIRESAIALCASAPPLAHAITAKRHKAFETHTCVDGCKVNR